MRRKYEKPQVTEVRLFSNEVVLQGCKNQQFVGPSDRPPHYVYACGWAELQPCYSYSAGS